MAATSAWSRLPILSNALAIGGGVLLLAGTAASANPPSLVTNSAQLRALSRSNTRVHTPVRIEGTVLLVDTPRNRLALSDDTGIILLSLDTIPAPLHSGDRVRLEGDCAVEAQVITLGRTPVVDNDGLHSVKEKSGSVHLGSGRHSFRVEWFDAGGDIALEASWAGPGFERQAITSNRLFHFESLGNGSNLVSGLEYRSYEDEWTSLTNFAGLTPNAQGATPNIDAAVRSRSNNVALAFNGFIEIPRDGTYTFWTVSDDGSRLFLDEQSARVQILGRGPLPDPARLVPEQLITNEPQWAQVEGRVVFVGRKLDGWELELRARGGRIDVQLPEAADYHPETWLRSEVRITGLVLNAYTTDGISVAGQLLVPGPQQVQVLQPGPEHQGSGEARSSESLPVLTTIEQVHRLKRDEADLRYPVLIRGVVTCAWNWNVNGMIQDSTRGIFIPNLTPGSATGAQIGDYLEVEGDTGPGDFAPVINATRVTLLGRGMLPEPTKPTWDQLMTGSLDCQFVELEGVVTSLQTNGFTLLMRGGRLVVELEGWDRSSLRVFENARVRARGALSAAWDPDSHQVVSGRVLLHPIAIDIEEPAPADLFATPNKGIEELRQFDADAGAFQRVKLSGQIVHQRTGEYFFMAGTNGARFLPRPDQTCRVGDLVEVVGFPEIDGPSPLLRDAVVRRVGSAPLGPARQLLVGTTMGDSMDSTRVEMKSRVLAARWEQGQLVLEMQNGTVRYLARLECARDEAPILPIGSLVRLTGVCAESTRSRNAAAAGHFELLLNTPSDIVMLARPSWWTVEHALGLATVLGGVLLLAVGWIRSLRGQVEQRTRELQREIEHHKCAEAEVKAKAKLLTAEIEERKRLEQEAERVHKQLLTTSRKAGMADVATSILHNVGNVLNSVNVSAGVIAENLRQSKAPSLLKVAELLRLHAGTAGFLVSDEKGKQIPAFLQGLGERLAHEQRTNAAELRGLQDNIEHIKRIVAMQQSYARLGGLVEKVRLSEIVEDAIRINTAALARHNVELVRDFQADPELLIEKHKVLQIVVNLIQNAKYACESRVAGSQIAIGISLSASDRVKVTVTDNGCGITPQNLKKIFSPGFTTRKEGHGFGLHGCILAARDLHGDLTVHSEGNGAGARFTLELPLDKNAPNPPAQLVPLPNRSEPERMPAL